MYNLCHMASSNLKPQPLYMCAGGSWVFVDQTNDIQLVIKWARGPRRGWGSDGLIFTHQIFPLKRLQRLFIYRPSKEHL